MEITCKTEKLRNMVGLIDRLTAKHPSLPILSYILCTTRKDSISFRATNLSIGAEGVVDGNGGEESIFAIEGKAFLQALSGGGDSETTLNFKNETLTIVSGKYKTTLKTFPYDDFPTLPVITGTTITIPSTTISQGINSVVYAAASSDIKPEISSVYIYPEETSLTFCATDTFRLAEKKISLPDTYGFQPLLIPAKNALEIAKILQNIVTTVTVSFSETQLTISYKGMVITSRVVSGSFPNYRQIIPKQSQTEATFLISEFEESLKSLTSFSDKFNQITITFNPKEKKCICKASNGEKGEQVAELDGALQGEDVQVAVNARFILEMLPVITTDSITISLSGGTKPAVIRPVSDASFLYLIMPINR